MRRFGLKSLILVVTYVALWASLFSNYTGVEDVRAFLMTSIVVASGVAAYFATGRQQAFWLGFFGTLLVFTSRFLSSMYGARFIWVSKFVRDLSDFWAVNAPERGTLGLGIQFSLVFGTSLIAATLIGFLCVHVYDQVRSAEKQSE